MSEPGFNGTLVVVDAWRNVLLWRLSETGNLSKVVCNSKWVLAPLPNWGYVYVWRMADDESSASNTVPRVRLLMGPAKKALVVFTDFFGPNICVYVEYWGEPLEVKVTFIDLEKSYRAGRIIEFRPFMLASISISTLGLHYNSLLNEVTPSTCGHQVCSTSSDM
ncbi:hypothetical protein Pelo_19447 [Pelomyxa schiedti]|nr:hypothetical protein Pelo_19447 [Pelomyxa schiedti]